MRATKSGIGGIRYIRDRLGELREALETLYPKTANGNHIQNLTVTEEGTRMGPEGMWHEVTVKFTYGPDEHDNEVL